MGSYSQVVQTARGAAVLGAQARGRARRGELAGVGTHGVETVPGYPQPTLSAE